MNPGTFNQVFQYSAFFLAIGQFVVGLYILLSNAWHTANRHLSALLLAIAANTFAIGALSGARTIEASVNPILILAVTTPAVQSLLLLATLALLQPSRLTGRRRWLWWPVYVLAFAPALIIGADLWLGTGYLVDLHRVLAASLSLNGSSSLGEVVGGQFSWIFFPAVFYATGLLTLAVALYTGFMDRRSIGLQRRLGVTILVIFLLVGGVQIGLEGRSSLAFSTLIANTTLALTYGILAFIQMAAEHRLQRGRLGVRLTAMILSVVVPVLIGLSLFMTNQAANLLEDNANQSLVITGEDLAADTGTWLEYNLRALKEMVALPDIVSMDPERQKPFLEAMDRAYADMYLVSTTDLTGLNVARSDTAPLTDYADRSWFQQAAAGEPVAYQTLIGRTSGQPALVVSTPIYAQNGNITGVGMFAIDLDAISAQVNVSKIGPRGLSYILDDANRVIAHPDPELTANLQDYSDEPALERFNAGIDGPFSFQDRDGVRWRAYGQRLENGWTAIVQVPEAELFAPVSTFRRLAWISLIAGSLLVALLSWMIIRQSLEPVRVLTRVSEEIATGDLSRIAQVETDDEFGLLARTFNRMATQIRDLVATLERRVAERTRELERRAIQLQVTAEVAREAAGIRDLDRLLNDVVRLISNRFNFYHAGIFLIDESRTYAILQAASSEGGQRMLARRHRLKIGEEGIVGYVAASAEPRIALDVGEDAVYFDNPDMPQTRSEMALPMTARDQVIGVLDVQSTKAAAFSEEDVAILQVLSDQIALAIDNVRLLRESRQTLEELRNQYSLSVSRAWQKTLAHRTFGYRYDLLGAHPLDSPPGQVETASEDSDPYLLTAPIQLRDERIGKLSLRRDVERGAWTDEERQMVSTALEQLVLALENARLMEQNRRQIQHEQLIGEIAARTSSSLNLETVMRRAVQEIGEALGAERVRIHINPGMDESESNGRQA